MTDEYLTVEQAATLLKISRSTLRRWLTNGLGPPVVNLGERLLRYRREDVDAWVKMCARKHEQARE